MAESPKFTRLAGNLDRGTPSGVRDINLPDAIQFCFQDALRMDYRQITYEVTLISSDIIRTARSLWTWLWGRYHVLQNVFLVKKKKTTIAVHKHVHGSVVYMQYTWKT